MIYCGRAGWFNRVWGRCVEAHFKFREKGGATVYTLLLVCLGCTLYRALIPFHRHPSFRTFLLCGIRKKHVVYGSSTKTHKHFNDGVLPIHRFMSRLFANLLDRSHAPSRERHELRD